MSLQTNYIKIDGSLNVNGSIYKNGSPISAGGASLEYVDGSLAIRDSSIGNLYISKTDKTLFDSSIAYLTDNTYTKDEMISNFVNLQTNQSITAPKTFTEIINIAEQIIHTGDTDTKIILNTNNIEFFAGNATYNKIELLSSSVVINEDSQDYDFRVESDGNANMLFVDGGTNRVGIGTATPDASLTVIGELSASSDIRTQGRKIISGWGGITGYTIGPSNLTSEVTINTFSMTDSVYESNLLNKLFRLTFSGRWVNTSGSNTVTIRIKKGTTTLLTITLGFTASEYYKIIAEFGPKDGTTTFGNYQYMKGLSTIYYNNIGSSGVSHGSENNIVITAQKDGGLGVGAIEICMSKLEVIKNI